MTAPADPGSRRKKQVRPLTPDRLRNIALFYVARYAASTARLRRVLMRRVERDAQLHGGDSLVDAGMVESLIRRFAETGLVDDAAWARARAAALHRRGQPVAGIRRSLAVDETGQEEITAALEALDPDAAAADLAAAVLYARRRRLGPFRAAADRPAHHQRDLAALARRGFDYATASQVLAASGPDDLIRPEDGEYPGPAPRMTEEDSP